MSALCLRFARSSCPLHCDSDRAVRDFAVTGKNALNKTFAHILCYICAQPFINIIHEQTPPPICPEVALSARSNIYCKPRRLDQSTFLPLPSALCPSILNPLTLCWRLTTGEEQIVEKRAQRLESGHLQERCGIRGGLGCVATPIPCGLQYVFRPL